jgi:topoisomerase-4 subunit A
VKIEEGVSTLGGRNIYYNPETKRLNDSEYGDYLGEFKGSDKILVVSNDGSYGFTTFDLTNHFEMEINRIEKFVPGKIWSAVFYDAEQKYYYLKRFEAEETSKFIRFIGDHNDSKLIAISDDAYPQIEVQFGGKHADRENEVIDVEEFIAVKGVKARGKRITTYTVKKILFIEPLDKEPMQHDEPVNDGGGDDDVDIVHNPDIQEDKKSDEPKNDTSNQSGSPNQMSLF